MGLRMAAMACQRVTTAVREICSRVGYDVFNYLDDFIGVEETRDRAEAAFRYLATLLSDLGLVESLDKAELPDTQMVVIGILFDTDAMTMSATQSRLSEIEDLFGSITNELRSRSYSPSSSWSLSANACVKVVYSFLGYWFSYVFSVRLIITSA